MEWITFVESRKFERVRRTLWSDEEFAEFQEFLTRNPLTGDVIPGTNGLRKVRFSQPSRNKGKRGGVRVIYLWQRSDSQIWLLSMYSKDKQNDLNDQDLIELSKLVRSFNGE